MVVVVVVLAVMVMRLSERNFLDGTIRKRETKSEQRKANSEKRKETRTTANMY